MTQLEEMQAWQEEQIRRTTRSLGFDPLALPVDDPGRNSYVKSIVRARCVKNHPVKMRAAMFNQTWERMLERVPPTLKYRGA